MLLLSKSGICVIAYLLGFDLWHLTTPALPLTMIILRQPLRLERIGKGVPIDPHLRYYAEIFAALNIA